MDSESDSSTINEIMGMAVAEQARRFTYCLIDDTGEAKVGTAVAIQVSKRFFLATAAHVIKDSHSVKALVRDQVAQDVADFVARHCDNRFDVGLLEVSPSSSHRLEFLALDRLCRTIDEEQELPTMVVGFPGQFCKPVKEIDLTTETLLRLVRCDTLSFHTVILPRSEWPPDGLPDEHGSYGQLVDGRDMLIDYAPEPQVRPFTPKTTGRENPPVECASLDPHGISGGGIWLAQIAESKQNLYHPDTRLIGLQLSWYRDRNLLRGVRIGAWLDLVRERYPDLREVLKTQES